MSNNDKLLDFSKWNRRLINLFWICCAVVLVVQIIIAAYYFDAATMTIMSVSISRYTREVIILPFALMLLLTAACKTTVFLLQKNHKNWQPYVITFTCAALSTVLIVIHYGINVIFVTCIIPVIFSLAYDDKKVLFYTFIFSSLDFLGAYLYLKYSGVLTKLDFAEVITNIAIIVVVYLICRIIMERYREIVKIMSETTKHNLYLLDKVHYDEVTGIFNRRYLEETLERVISSAARSNGLLSLMMIDVDYFEKYNDTYGHNMGDKCLKSIAESLSNSISRSDDFVARYGGEEFVIVLPNTDKNGALVIANVLLENIVKCNIPHEKSDTADCVTVSIGVTTASVEYTHRAEDYIKRADEALYVSKQNGRNRYTFLDF